MYQQNVTLGPGTGNFTSHTLEILIMLLGAFLLGVWLGWVMWNRYKQEADRLRLENEGLLAGTMNLNTELGALKGRFTTLDNERADLATRLQIAENENTDLRARLSNLSQDITEVTSENRQLKTELDLNTGEVAAIESQAQPVADDDTVIPFAKIQAPEQEEEIVIAPGKSPSVTLTIEMNDPHSTITIEKPMTDRPAENTEEADAFVPVMEDHLPDFQTGYDTANSRNMNAPVVTDHFSDEAFEALTRNSYAPETEETATETSAVPVLTALQQDDLKIVEGIGPKIEQLLFKAGIHTYSELAAAPVSRLKEILAEAGSRYAMHDPGTWSAQALLAANGEWENLKAYQEFLDAGKRPTT